MESTYLLTILCFYLTILISMISRIKTDVFNTTDIDNLTTTTVTTTTNIPTSTTTIDNSKDYETLLLEIIPRSSVIYKNWQKTIKLCNRINQSNCDQKNLLRKVQCYTQLHSDNTNYVIRKMTLKPKKWKDSSLNLSTLLNGLYLFYCTSIKNPNKVLINQTKIIRKNLILSLDCSSRLKLVIYNENKNEVFTNRYCVWRLPISIEWLFKFKNVIPYSIFKDDCFSSDYNYMIADGFLIIETKKIHSNKTLITCDKGKFTDYVYFLSRYN